MSTQEPCFNCGGTRIVDTHVGPMPCLACPPAPAEPAAPEHNDESDDVKES